MDKKKRIELAAVSKFLKNRLDYEGDSERNDFDLNPEEPADILYIPTGEKFQVTQAIGEIGQLINKGVVSFEHKSDETYNEFIRIPIERKLKKYGGGDAVSDVILLIYDNVESPWLVKIVEQIKRDPEKQNFFQSSGFKAIYCVFNFQDTNGVIEIYTKP